MEVLCKLTCGDRVDKVCSPHICISWIVPLDYWTVRQALAVQVVVLHLECEYSTTWTSFHRTVATTTRTPRKKWNPRTFEYFYYFIACVIEITEFSFSLAPCILGIYTYFNILLRNRWIHEASTRTNQRTDACGLPVCGTQHVQQPLWTSRVV